MSNRSEDEWSLVSDDEVLSESSYDEVDPEPEAFEEIEAETCYLFSLTPSVQPRVTLERSASFPDRLRALTAAMRPLPEDVQPPTYTEVTAFKQDQSTQVNLDATAPESRGEPREALLRSALDRSMMMANQLRSKSQDKERLSFRIAELESQAKLTAEYHDSLKAIADDLRHKNAQLEARQSALRGKDEALALRSLDDLEELEAELARGMDRVRAALRAKYRAAMDKQREKEQCVVCFAKPVSVVLLPCRHQVLCASCALRVTTCPIDRQDIKDKVLTYGLSAYNDDKN
ncbi:hypothetical protein PHYSODRAFT_484646 [Phytophthora sojae]|uniref:RING-type domain-containing protein n=1 Tax=Phytophthora sojae (strain P6497) TaxID=1094619 RepID=G4Z1Q1_PHYSP|nr:hypothetical protein PHYSODRAFT_484646 [Phytophthora sojae]EGZ26419.1 hypothetical protein PHYSODRAFT_484646 [Phytophthora sojae]|eukprot:XP_009521707.1 hypothetical protein PHYSODRAFT_484646 [Phytophthora sojae]